MREVFHLIHRLSHVDTTVLIRGENGTGKNCARAIHQNSPRKHGEFVAINYGAIPENLMESEIFGHEKGAFTGAVQRKLGRFNRQIKEPFLDEIGELKTRHASQTASCPQEKSLFRWGQTAKLLPMQKSDRSHKS